MTAKVFLGSILAYTYNGLVGKLPSRHLRSWLMAASTRRFGRQSSVQLDCKFLNPRNVSIGERNVINFGCLLDGRRFGITTGSDVSIGPEASILTLGHDPQSPSFADRGGDVTIGDRVWIGYRAIILPGITIGEGAVVGAGAIVTKDVRPYTIVAGNPAREVGKREANLNYTLEFDPWLV